MNTFSITKSLKLMQIEKMVIVLKELKHIQNILDFFSGYKEDNKTHESKPIKKNINLLQKDIKALQKKIETLQSIHENMSSDSLMLFLIKYDYIRTQIEDLLGVIDALYHKMQQQFGETLNQYLPYPILGRRFSNNGIMMYLNNYYREMLKEFLGTTEVKRTSSQLILGWNFKTGFKYRIFVNREIKREGYNKESYNNYIDLPYWYYELPMLLPSVTHEVAAIALRNPHEHIARLFQALKHELHNFLMDTNNNFVQKVQDIIGYDEYGDELAKEIMSDVIAFQVHKEAYVHALFHNVIAEKLSKDYLKVMHKKKDEYLKIVPNEWYFNQKKDHAILRLHFLLHLIKDKSSSNYSDMLKILNTLMPLDNYAKIQEGFSKTYQYNYPNFKSSYQSVQNYLMQTLNVLKIWHENNREKFKDIPTPIEEESPSFKRLWEERYTIQLESQQSYQPNMVMHQSNFRQEIHSKISKLDFLKEESSNDESLIYILELGKVRKDISFQTKEKIDIIKQIEDTITSDKYSSEVDTLSTKHFSVYGIYDWAILKEKKSSINIVDKLETLLKSSDKEAVKYFKTKQVLLKVTPEICGTINPNETQTFSVIYNIELEKSIGKDKSITNGYKDLKVSILNIIKTLTNPINITKFSKANIYKSLGPKDLTLIIEESSLEFIFNFISQLNKITYDEKEPNILRTFSMICTSFETPNIKFEKPFNLVSYLRISNTFTKNDLKMLIEKQKKHIKSLYEITGVMDYRLEWIDNIEINEVFKFYNEMIESKCLTDFQTKIEKKEELLI